MDSHPSDKNLTLDSTHLFLSTQSSPPDSLIFPPIPRTFPPSKHVPNTRFLIDAFRYAADFSVSYFLSHFHSDHYTGLSPSWSKGIIFCSEITSRLLSQILNINPKFIYPLPIKIPVLIDGCEVVLVGANHCPGAVQFLFKVPGRNDGFERYVHTGDFRFCKTMLLQPVMNEFAGCDAVFLDTTYCNPKFLFPLQEESVEYVVSVINRVGGELNEGLQKRVLFLVATYVIGKEKILIEIFKKCGRKVCVDSRKMEVLRVLGYGDSGVFTEDESETDVHVVGWNVLGETWPYFRPNFVRMKEIMVERGYDKVVGFVPTGWTYEVKRNKFAVRSKDAFEIHLVPYSEHSNYDELREYVKFLKPKRVIPTVGMDIEKLDSKHANKMRKYFAGLVDEMASKKEFLMGFHRGTSEIDENVEEGAGSGSNEGLSKEGEVKSKKTKATEDSSSSILLDSSSRLEEFGSKDVTALDDEETEKMVQEIRNCLPTWVTQNQILDLISSSGRNIVDAVSNFYEHETQLYEQVSACTTFISASRTSSLDVSASTAKLNSDKTISQGSVKIPLSQEYKLPTIKHSIKSTLSPSKRKKTVTNNPKKKGKVPSKMESSGAKQPTITSFFNKLLPNMSQGDGIESKSEECPKDENPLQSNAIKTYGEEIDQFLKIINGNESLKGYAATLLEKTKGNVSMALDLYYDNQEGDRGKTVNRLEFSKSSVQSDSCNKDCSSALEKIVSEELQHITDMSVQRPSKELMDPTLVSLPPEKYDPIEHACWSSGQPAPYIHLARTFDLVEAERGKIKAMSMLCNMFRSLLALSPDDVLPAVYLCTNKIASNHENIELNIGGSLVTSAIEEACGTNRSKIRDMYNRLGDLGDVAQECRQTQALPAPPPPLLIKDVYSMLCKISVQTGSGSTARKKSLIVNLMCSCREKEMKFLVRTLVRNLRIGAMMRTILPALAQAVVMNSSLEFSHEGKMENLKEKLQSLSAAAVEAYNILPSLDLLIPSLMNKGIGFSASTLSMVPGVPIKPMLAKYDGQRAQIHKLVDGTVRIFSRNGDETTSRFPDLISIINEFCKPAAGTFILDAEVVAIDRKNGCKIMSFQELSSRERGGKDSVITIKSVKAAGLYPPSETKMYVYLVSFLFSYKTVTAFSYLKDLFYDEKMGYFQYAKEMTVEADDNCLTSDVTLTKINNFLEEALHSSCEGIIVKSLDVDAGYSPSKRSDSWLKVKRDYVEGLNDSLDLVPIGAWHGNGRKAGWYSPFLMACYNPETEEYQSVCRVMSGFSDSFYIEMKEFFSGDKILLKKPSYYRTAEVPDMWFSPEVVWEIRGADFTISPVHQAAIGLVHPSRGISIRFPRFIRLVSDRNPDECSTAADIAEMFHSQTRKMDADPPDPSKIREEDIIGVTVLLLTCSYLGQEFVRVGYYVNNDYGDEQLREEPPQKVLIDTVQRNILSDKPRVTKFPINFHPEHAESGEEPPPPPHHPAEVDPHQDDSSSPPDHPLDNQEP
ncbi:DNA ligase 6 [Citrus sinensis]|uniref:DNA ligase 6 n=1 Tax=Citrus sinensis TaxID=2711 RepID=A0ACB8K237_CITSI|nr:DNA ligase 6 [Citrus sinensis]